MRSGGLSPRRANSEIGFVQRVGPGARTQSGSVRTSWVTRIRPSDAATVRTIGSFHALGDEVRRQFEVNLGFAAKNAFGDILIETGAARQRTPHYYRGRASCRARLLRKTRILLRISSWKLPLRSTLTCDVHIDGSGIPVDRSERPLELAGPFLVRRKVAFNFPAHCQHWADLRGEGDVSVRHWERVSSSAFIGSYKQATK